MDDIDVYTAIAVMAAVTLGTRLGGPILVARFPKSGRLDAVLNAMANAVFAGVVGTVMMSGGLRESAAILTAAIVMYGSNRPMTAMIAGVAVAAAWRFWIGG